MKMLKKLLAVVLTGAIALTLLTACGSNAVTDKSIADALNDMAKAQGEKVTFTPRPKERELAKKIAELIEKESATATVADGKDSSNNAAEEELKRILGIDDGGANEESRFVWWGAVVADEIGTAGQAYNVMNNILSQKAVNAGKLTGKKPGNIRCMGTALGTMTFPGGEQKTVRFIVVTAEAVDKK